VRVRKSNGGFTLVELLTVLGILAILVAILMPAISAARRSAKTAATKAMIASIDTSIESFHVDFKRYPRSGQTGNGYPLVGPDDGFDQDLGVDSGVVGPDDDTTGPGFGKGRNGSYMTGAHWLVYELMGADRKGHAEPQNATDSNGDGIIGEAELLTVDREGLFLAPENAEITVDDDLGYLTQNTGNWEPPVTQGEVNQGAPGPANRRYTGLDVFLDNFGRPILYYRADAAASRRPNAGVHEIYNITDNALWTGFVAADLVAPPTPLYTISVAGALSTTDATSGGTWFVDRPEDQNRRHPLGRFGFTTDAVPPAPYGYPRINPPTDEVHANQIVDVDASGERFRPARETYAWLLHDSGAVQASVDGDAFDGVERVRPVQADRFLLISAGADGIYGTTDDIANYQTPQ
jgi:prepilin-type N-terminal cleavage/methylation domain-containing protein